MVIFKTKINFSKSVKKIAFVLKNQKDIVSLYHQMVKKHY